MFYVYMFAKTFGRERDSVPVFSLATMVNPLLSRLGNHFIPRSLLIFFPPFYIVLLLPSKSQALLKEKPAGE